MKVPPTSQDSKSQDSNTVFRPRSSSDLVCERAQHSDSGRKSDPLPICDLLCIRDSNGGDDNSQLNNEALSECTSVGAASVTAEISEAAVAVGEISDVPSKRLLGGGCDRPPMCGKDPAGPGLGVEAGALVDASSTKNIKNGP